MLKTGGNPVTKKNRLTNVRPSTVEIEERNVVAAEDEAIATPAGDASDPIPLPGPLATGPVIRPSEGHTVPPPIGVTMRKRAAALKPERAAFHRQAAEYAPRDQFQQTVILCHRVVAAILDEFALIDERMDQE